MKTQSSLLKTINSIFNVLWYLLIFLSILLIPTFLLGELPIEVKFSLKQDGNLFSQNGEVYHLKFEEMTGVATFTGKGIKTPFSEVILFILVVITMLFGLFQLKKFINDIKNGIVFQKNSYRRLRYVGFAILFSGLLEMLDFFFIQNYYAQFISHEAIIIETGFNWLSDFGWSYLIFGLIFFVFAEAFKEGFALKQETELTI